MAPSSPLACSLVLLALLGARARRTADQALEAAGRDLHGALEAVRLGLTAAVGDWRLTDCTLYVTKEPCPMCSGATVMARLGEVHYAVEDPKMGGLGGAASLHTLPFSNHKPKVFRKTMELECKEMLQAFFQLQRK